MRPGELSAVFQFVIASADISRPRVVLAVLAKEGTWQTGCPFPYPPRLFKITRAFCRSSIAACGHNATAVSYAARATAKLSAAAIIRSPLGATSTILNSSSIAHEENKSRTKSQGRLISFTGSAAMDVPLQRPSSARHRRKVLITPLPVGIFWRIKREYRPIVIFVTY